METPNEYTYVALIDAKGFVVGTGRSRRGFQDAESRAVEDNYEYHRQLPYVATYITTEDFFYAEMNWKESRGTGTLNVSHCSEKPFGRLHLKLYQVLTDGIFADGPVTLEEANLLRAQYSAAGCDDVTVEEY